MSKKEHKIYIILTYTGTWLSKVIRVYTKAKYCHVSISLDENLEQMYSFGRLYAYNPFFAGFVHESPKWGTFKRFKKTEAAIYSLDLTKKQYYKIKGLIKQFQKNKQKYKFNIIGLFASGFNLQYRKKDTFYCSEFVKYLIDESGVNLDLPKLVRPTDFEQQNPLELQYKGILKEYIM